MFMLPAQRSLRLRSVLGFVEESVVLGATMCTEACAFDGCTHTCMRMTSVTNMWRNISVKPSGGAAWGGVQASMVAEDRHQYSHLTREEATRTCSATTQLAAISTSGQEQGILASQTVRVSPVQSVLRGDCPASLSRI
eukprot:1189788-Prorocentrum_minimum.AAC.2